MTGAMPTSPLLVPRRTQMFRVVWVAALTGVGPAGASFWRQMRPLREPPVHMERHQGRNEWSWTVAASVGCVRGRVIRIPEDGQKAVINT